MFTVENWDSFHLTDRMSGPKMYDEGTEQITRQQLRHLWVAGPADRTAAKIDLVLSKNETEDSYEITELGYDYEVGSMTMKLNNDWRNVWIGDSLHKYLTEAVRTGKTFLTLEY